MDELFETIFFKALKADSTDIHFKLTDHLSIQFIVFGELQPYQEYEKTTGAKIMNYLKYKSFINVNYKMVPQTGAFHYYLNEHIYFLRVSYLPGMDFESIVIRILNNHENITINEISEIDDFTFYLNEVCYQKSGLFLVAGATGSGKSTTLYAILDKIIEMGGRNVVTLEDPIEIVKEHCLQIEMNESMGIDYYNSLKQILRHDPDVIMIGEIRDSETAKIAIRSSITGHLVLSTLHTNDTVASITRLKDMGIDLYLISASLVGVISQRLVRKVCPKCSGIKYDCDYCSGKGYLGRTIVYEILQVDDEIRECIRNLDRHKEIREIAIERGKMITFEDSYISISQRALAENI